MQRNKQIWKAASAAVLVASLFSSRATAATANNQNVTVVQGSVNNSFTLSGSGTNWTLVSGPSHGTVYIYSSGSGYINWTNNGTGTYAYGGYVQYTPAPASYTGPDAFSWFASAGDGSGASPTATCSIAVAANSVPVANPQSVSMLAGTVHYGISLSYTHTDNSQPCTWTLVTAPINGALQYNSGGYQTVPVGTPLTSCYWYYTTNGNAAATDTFVWYMSDGISTSGNATCVPGDATR